MRGRCREKIFLYKERLYTKKFLCKERFYTKNHQRPHSEIFDCTHNSMVLIMTFRRKLEGLGYKAKNVLVCIYQKH